MGESKKWRMDYSSYPEPDKGLLGAGETIVHVILALCALSAVYTFFDKTELEPKVKSPVVKTKPVEMKASDSWGGIEEESRPDAFK